MRYYVYALIDPRDYRIRYVGKWIKRFRRDCLNDLECEQSNAIGKT